MSWNPDEIPGYTSFLVGENRPRALHEYVGHWKDADTFDEILGEITENIGYTQFTEYLTENKSLRETDLKDLLGGFLRKARDGIAKYRELAAITLESKQGEYERKEGIQKTHIKRLKDSHLHEFGCKFWDYAKEGRINSDEDELMRCTCLYKEL